MPGVKKKLNNLSSIYAFVVCYYYQKQMEVILKTHYGNIMKMKKSHLVARNS